MPRWMPRPDRDTCAHPFGARMMRVLTTRASVAATAAVTLTATALVASGCGLGVSDPTPSRTVADRFSVTTITEGLTSPWGLAFLPDGGALVSERDTAAIKRVTPDGAVTTISTVQGVVPGGEGGLLGITLAPDTAYLYAYLTAADDNRVVRMAWDGTRLGAPEAVVTGIPKANIHNGGRITFGPDGMLYVATGDAGATELAQQPDSLGGKVLRVTPAGEPAPGNPTPGSPVYSLGHRNVQGLAFDASGALWASEFGSSKADELNEIIPGGNYGWPEVEGRGGTDRGYVDPVTTWEPTSLASPSGIAVLGDDVYVASLRGRVLWEVPLGDPATPAAVGLGDLGRLRTIEPAADGSLWLITSNTDGRGEPRDGDDRIVRLQPR